MNFLRRLLLALWCLFLFGGVPHPALAQLAQSFYNITGIETRTLPNGLQITIRADGAINMGVDRNEFIHTGSTGYSSVYAQTLDSFRLRFVGARAQIPAYTDIGSYPADFAEATLGRDELTGSPFFYNARQDPSKTDPTLPRVDLRFHFYVPIKVSRFTFVYGQDYPGWNFSYGGMQPREASVAVAADRRSVVITVISDRVETVRGIKRLARSPALAQKHHLTVTGGAVDNALMRLDVLHQPLAQVADEFAHATGIPLIVPAAESALDVSLFLPATRRDDALRTLARACGLTIQPRPAVDGGGAVLTRGGSGGGDLTTERIPLRYLRPASARLLLPDFLLPRLHVDDEHNALVVSGDPNVTARIRSDLSLLDRPRPQVRVEAAVYELQRSDADRLNIQADFAGGRPTVDTAAENLSITLQTGQTHPYNATINALVAQSRARLVARPSLTVASGESGTIFAGQTRYITVLQTDYSYGGGQNVQAIQLPVGTTLTVTPTASAPATESGTVPIVLDMSASVATVDSIEAKTNLPTIGTRQVSTVVRIQAGDSLMLAGLGSTNEAQTHRRLAAPWRRLPIVGYLLDRLTRSHDDASNSTELIVLVTARLVGDSDAAAKVRAGEGL